MLSGVNEVNKMVLLALAGFSMATPALAASRACLLTDISPAAAACTGFFDGNLLSGNAGDRAAQTSALSSLGFAWNGNFSQITKINSLGGKTTVDFSTADQNPLTKQYGDTWVGIHFGKGAGLGSNATGFWRFNAGSTGVTSFLLTITKGSSGAVLYSTQMAPPPPPPPPPPPMSSMVPEPGTWAMLIAGFGLVGATARRRRTAATAA